MQTPDVKVRITSDTSGLNAGVAQASKGLSEVADKSRTLASAQGAAATASTKFGGSLQNTSYQLQDFIVQVNGGVSATQALSMQLPQLLGGFGAMGAAVGVAVALLPNLIAAFASSEDGAVSLKDALSGLEGAIDEVGRTVQTFDMEGLYEEFNASSGAVRAATIEQIKFQQAFLETQRLTTSKSFGESLQGIGAYGFFDKLTGGGSEASRVADDLGITLDVAERLAPVLKGLRDGTEDVGSAFTQFGVALLSGGPAAIELARSMQTLANGEKDAYAASSALSEALERMAKGHVRTKKEAEEGAKASKKYADDVSRAAKEAERNAAALDALIEKIDNQAYAASQKALAALDAEAAKLEDQVALYGMTEAQIAAVTLRRAEEQLQIARGLPDHDAEVAALEREVEIRRQIAASAGKLEAKRANTEAAEEAARAWERTAQEIEGAIYDAIVGGGQDARDVLERTFKALVLRPIIQAIVAPVAGQITGSMGFGGSGGASSGGGGFNIPGMGNVGLLSSGVQMLGGALGSTAISSFGAGLGMTGAQASGLAGAGLVNGGAAGLGSMVGAALPWVGAGLALASVFGIFDKKPSDKSAWATANPMTGAMVDVGSMTGKKDPGQEARDATAQLAQYLSAFAKDAGINRNLTVMTGARDGFRVDLAGGLRSPTAPRGNGGYGYNFGAVGEEAMQRILSDLVDEGTLPQETIDAWRQMRTDAQGAARDAQEQIDVLDLLTQGINKAEIERANTMQQAGETLAAAYARMVAVENAIHTAISETFDTPAERLADAFKDMGQAIPQTVAEYERLVLAQDLTTESGRNQAVALLNVKGLWDEAQQAQVQAAEEAARAAEEALAVWARLRDDLTAFRADLTTGALAGLSPEAAYRAAQGQFADTSRLAGLGNQDALAQLAEVGRALLEASRAYNAGTEAYYADRDTVLGAVDSGLALTGRKIAGFAGGGMFGGGLRIVGERGPELEATGASRIWSAQQTQAMLGGGAEVVRELQAVVRVLSTGLSSMDRRLANLERSSDEQARVARLAADRRAA